MKTNILFKNISLWLSAGIAAAALSACADDDMGVAAHSGEDIQFEVANSSSWTHAVSRGGSRGQKPAELTLVSGTDSLYLSAVESDDWHTVTSRSTMVNSNDGMETIGVFATRSGQSSLPAYMNNVKVTKSANWTPATEYLWPGDGPLHFNAYSPYVAAGNDEGILTVPQLGDGDSLMIDYLTPADVADQIDLMTAMPCDASASPCKLVFNHALTAIRFVTGAQMSPCTVSKIEITGAKSRGKLNLESGLWSEPGEPSDYSVSPDLKLDAAANSKFVEPGVAITSDDQTFILLPQQLSDDSKIVLTVEVNGNASTFEASLAGQTWTAGRTVTYRLSASAGSSNLILSVEDADGNTIDKLNAKYTGSKLDYNVKSYYTPDGSTMQPVEWEATLVDKDGNELQQSPDWIISYTTDGSGETSAKMQTDFTTPIFLQMSDATRTLRSAADINSTSGHEYYNLSNPTGADAVVNTANCYVINAPGKYSLPLVYGNAVKDGANNSSAYVSTLDDTSDNERCALLKFINHLGNAITDPYIYNNAGCEPDSAMLIWEEKIGLIRNLTLSADKKSLEFEIPAGFIRQGNADIAVCDKSGAVMWSWQLWVTDFVNGSDWYTVPVEGKDFHLYPHTLGRVDAGDKTQFSADSVVMRLTQKDVPDGMQGLTVDITVELAEKVISSNDYYSYYQWGRKDPLVSNVEQFYDGNRNEVKADLLPTEPFGTDHKAAIKQSILHPGLFLTGPSDMTITPFYVNLWSIDNASMIFNGTNTPNVKTIYDPCPVGAKVPIGNEFLSLMKYDYTYDESTSCLNITLPDGRILNFSILGDISRTGGYVINPTFAGFWTAVAVYSEVKRRNETMIREGAQYFYVKQDTGLGSFLHGSPIEGFGVRPVMDE